MNWITWTALIILGLFIVLCFVAGVCGILCAREQYGPKKKKAEKDKDDDNDHFNYQPFDMH